MLKTLSIIFASLVIASCSQHERSNRSVHVHCVSIENNKYRACYGPEIITNDLIPRIHSASNNTYLNYQVEVTEPVSNIRENVIFNKILPLSAVDSSLINERDANVVSYNSTTKTVTFNLIVSKVTYTIKPRAGL